MQIELVVFDMSGTTVYDGDAVHRCLHDALRTVGVKTSRVEINTVMGIAKPLAINAFGLPLSITFIFYTVFSILLTTPIAYLAWRFIETPCIRYGRRLSQQPTVLAAG